MWYQVFRMDEMVYRIYILYDQNLDEMMIIYANQIFQNLLY